MHQREKFEFPLRLKFTDRIKGTFEGHTCSKTVVKGETRGAPRRKIQAGSDIHGLHYSLDRRISNFD